MLSTFCIWFLWRCEWSFFFGEWRVTNFSLLKVLTFKKHFTGGRFLLREGPFSLLRGGPFCYAEVHFTTRRSVLFSSLCLHFRAAICDHTSVAALYISSRIFITNKKNVFDFFFSKKLVDIDRSNNLGNWKWVAGIESYSNDYYKAMSMESQMVRFDPDGIYIKKWIPELETPLYSKPIVDHKEAREKCLRVYKEAVT